MSTKPNTVGGATQRCLFTLRPFSGLVAGFPLGVALLPLVAHLPVGQTNVRSRAFFCFFVVGCFVALMVIVAFYARAGRDARLRKIEKTRTLNSIVARHESSPVVQGISKTMGTNLASYLQNKVIEQEKAANKAGDLISVTMWVPGLHSMRAKMDFLTRSRTNSAHFVGWKFSADDLVTGYVRPEEIGIWQSEFCTITNSVMWTGQGVFALVGGPVECLLPDGSHVRTDQLEKWLDESIEQGWSVGVSLVQKDADVLVGSRKKTGTTAQRGATPNERQ